MQLRIGLVQGPSRFGLRHETKYRHQINRKEVMVVDLGPNLSAQTMAVSQPRPGHVDRPAEAAEQVRADLVKITHPGETVQQIQAVPRDEGSEEVEDAETRYVGLETFHKLREIFVNIYQEIGYAPTMAEQRVDSFVGDFPPRIKAAIRDVDAKAVEAGLIPGDAFIVLEAQSIDFTIQRERDQTSFTVDRVTMRAEIRNDRGFSLMGGEVPLEVGNAGLTYDDKGNARHGVAKVSPNARQESSQRQQADPFQQSLTRLFGAENVMAFADDRGAVVRLGLDEVLATGRAGGGRSDDQPRESGYRPSGRGRPPLPRTPRESLDITV